MEQVRAAMSPPLPGMGLGAGDEEGPLGIVEKEGVMNGVLTALQDKQVLVISGDTGFWKSTQVPQMILDQWVEEGQGGRLQHS
ncbi:hypothetical protein O3P69_015121 [Scylla paramamosain]|uniref:Uncharacterized protein n=1 Tax=Scylla paramamosain TaxID=85552 RepID=A0AAW0T395_SCYPA